MAQPRQGHQTPDSAGRPRREALGSLISTPAWPDGLSPHRCGGVEGVVVSGRVSPVTDSGVQCEPGVLRMGHR